MLLNVSHLSKSYNGQTLIKDATFFVDEGKKYAIVGNNGCGKSTLLKMIVSLVEPDSGEVFIANDKTVGYLAQYQDDVIEEKIFENVLSARADLIEMEEKLHKMELKMGEVLGDDLDKLVDEYNQLHHTFEISGGLTYKSEAVGVLKGLGFVEEDFEKKISSLSGGQKTRVALSRLLIKNPDLLILDEPINHLDLSAVIWLEGFLNNYKKAVIIVAHDRYFLDKVVDHVVDLNGMVAHTYSGNYTAFVNQKAMADLTYQRSYEKQAKEIEHQQEVIRKLQSYNREKSIKRAESRKKLLERMDVLEAPDKDAPKMRLEFFCERESGNDVMFFNNVSKAYGEKKIFEDLSFEVHKNDRIAIMGDNGCGKTTVLKCINNVTEFTSGEIKLGTNVVIGYYDQEQQGLDDSKTIFDDLHDAYPEMTETNVRNTLAAFLFTEDDVFKRISALSGGERARLAFAKLMLSGANFLILDEPTNHLDMESKEILENALLDYDGTILFVSHDRYFINKISKIILEMNDGAFSKYLGNYDDYLFKKEQSTRRMDAISEDMSLEVQIDKSESKLSWEEKKAKEAAARKQRNIVDKIEKNIAEVEECIKKIDEELSNPAIATNSAKLNELSAKRNECEDKLMSLMEEWERESELLC